jgi:hypothetical protein
MERKVLAFVSHGEIVFKKLGLVGVKRHLVTGKPAIVTKDRGAVDNRGSQIEVDIEVGGKDFVLVLCLNLGRFLATICIQF